MRSPFVIAVAILALGACAPVGPTVDADSVEARLDGRCFYASEIHTFRRASGEAVYVRSNRGDVYRLDAPSGCFDAGTTGVVVEPYVGTGQTICVGEQARVRVARSSSTPLTCIARVEGPIVDSSVSGLPSRDHP